MKIELGYPNEWKQDSARDAIPTGDAAFALRHLARSPFGASYTNFQTRANGKHFLAFGKTTNVRRFLFIRSTRASECTATISQLLSCHLNPNRALPDRYP